MISGYAAFFLAFVFTNFLEFFPLNFLVKKPFWEKLAVLFLINAVTLPILWLVLPFFFSHYLQAFVVAEFLVLVAEVFLVRLLLHQSRNVALKVSVAMNLLSALVGFIFL